MRLLNRLHACRYPTAAKKTLEDVSIFCSLNSRVAVIGPNGAGKSTMIKVLTGLRITRVAVGSVCLLQSLHYASAHGNNVRHSLLSLCWNGRRLLLVLEQNSGMVAYMCCGGHTNAVLSEALWHLSLSPLAHKHRLG